MDSSSRYIKIYRDTKSRYMYLGPCLGRVITTLQDTIKIHHDTCILDEASEPGWIHTRYMRDTLQLHLGYVSWTRSICPVAQGAQGAPPLRRSSQAPRVELWSTLWPHLSWAASCVPVGGPARGRAAASVCWAASCVPERVASRSVVLAWAESM